MQKSPFFVEEKLSFPIKKKKKTFFLLRVWGNYTNHSIGLYLGLFGVLQMTREVLNQKEKGKKKTVKWRFYFT